MAFKDYWINSDEETDKTSEKVSAKVEADAAKTGTVTAPPGGTIKFPKSTMEKAPAMVGATSCAPYMDDVMALYEKGFEGLNQPGVEFFEYFKSVAGAGIDNPSAYGMAYNMLKGMEPDMSKASLLEQSKFYIDEINKVHQQYTAGGQKRKLEIENNRDTEAEKLKSDLDLLVQQEESIKTQISTKRLALDNIDSKYTPDIEEIGCKMGANDTAKEKILGTLNKVVAGIKANL